LYSSINIIKVIKSRMMIWPRHVGRIGHIRNAYNILDGKPKGKRPLGRHTSRWDDNIRTDFRNVR
jgi:hypothetical protein